MASRLAFPKVPRLTQGRDLREWAARNQRTLSQHVPHGEALHRAIWRTVTAPYWLGSDVPAPQLSVREVATPAAGLAGDHVAKLVNEIGRRVWLQRGLTIIARSLWLGILVGTLWLLLDYRWRSGNRLHGVSRNRDCPGHSRDRRRIAPSANSHPSRTDA